MFTELSAPLLLSAFLLGAVLGSFGNVLILRLPEGRSIGGRSFCTACKKILGVLELIPVISFLVQRGKCRGCGTDVSWLYPSVEVASGLLFIVAASFVEWSVPVRILLGIMLWLLLIVSLIDARIQAIPDLLSLPLVILSLVFALLVGRFDLLAIGVGVGFLGAQWLLSRGGWIGSGDLLLIAAISLMLGSVPRVALALLLAYTLGALVALPLLLLKKVTRRDTLAFGPFLAAAAVITLVMGDPLLSWYAGI